MNGRFPFGKHKGAAYADVPTQYLEWALEGVDFARFPDTRAAIEAELARRRGGPAAAVQRPDRVLPERERRAGFAIVKAGVAGLEERIAKAGTDEDRAILGRAAEFLNGALRAAP